jgi:hypothetical protein
MHSSFRLCSVITVLLGLVVLAGAESEAAVVVVPNDLAATEGNGASEFLTGDLIVASIRYQQVFAASQFSGLGAITEITFTPDGVLGTSFSTTLSNARIALSTTSRAPGGLSATFADNVGGDESVVYNGNLTLTSADLPGPNGTRTFDIIIGLTTPFNYDPGLGNLLLDFQRDGSTLEVSFDSENQAGDSISRAFGSRTSPTADRGVDTVGLVARFTVEAAAVPEPATFIVWSVLGALSITAGWWRRWKAA